MSAVLGRFVHHHSTERITNSVSGANEARMLGVVVQRLSNFCNQAGQIGVDHERIRPQSLVQFQLRQDARAVRDEQHQQIERLGRQMQLA